MLLKFTTRVSSKVASSEKLQERTKSILHSKQLTVATLCTNYICMRKEQTRLYWPEIRLENNDSLSNGDFSSLGKL